MSPFWVRSTALPLLSGHTGLSFTVVRSFFAVVVLNEHFATIRRRHHIPTVVVAVLSVLVILFICLDHSSISIASRHSSVSARPCRSLSGHPMSPTLLVSISLRSVFVRMTLDCRCGRCCPAIQALRLLSSRSSGCLSVVFWLCVWSVFSVICPVLSYPFSVVSLESVCFLFARPFVSVCACAV